MKYWNKIKSGDRSALYALYSELYFPLYRKGVKQCGDSDLTRDVINQIFLEIWEKRKSLNISNIKSYLFRMMNNKIIDEQRYQTRKYNLQEETLNIIQEQHELSYETLLIMSQRDEELKTRLRSAISNLSPRQIEMIELKFFENLTYEQIAEKTSVSIKSAYNTVYESVKQLRKVMKGSW